MKPKKKKKNSLDFYLPTQENLHHLIQSSIDLTYNLLEIGYE